MSRISYLIAQALLGSGLLGYHLEPQNVAPDVYDGSGGGNNRSSKRQRIAKKHRDNAKAKIVAKQKKARKHKNRRR